MKFDTLYSILVFVLSMLIVVFFYQIFQINRVRWDMTEEKRYTLSSQSIATLDGIRQRVYIEVYLDGNVPAPFLRLRKGVQDILDEFSVYGRIQYRFVAISEIARPSKGTHFFQYLIQKGLQPTSLNVRKSGQSSQKIIFPGAIISIGTEEHAINFLEGIKSSNSETIINEALEGLEYKFIQSFDYLTTERKKIGFIEDKDKIDKNELLSCKEIIKKKFDLEMLALESLDSISRDFHVVILPKPTQLFTPKEKYILDQYVMKGGNLLILYDALGVEMKNASGEGTFAFPNETHLEDLFFNYGFRINKNYVLDLNSGTFPVVTGNFGQNPQIQLLPWPFFPIITHYSSHPLVKSLDVVLLKFASTIDTVRAKNIKKTPLLKTSQRSKIMGYPVKVAFNDLQATLLPEYFIQGPFDVGYLFEGTFSSFFRNKPLPVGVAKENFKSEGLPSKIIVIADGDWIRNDVNENNKPFDLGMDSYAQIKYANDELLMRMLDYLADAEGLINLRKKTIKIRPMDKVKAVEEKLKWQIVNVGVPLLLIVLLGLTKYWVRKKIYTHAK